MSDSEEEYYRKKALKSMGKKIKKEKIESDSFFMKEDKLREKLKKKYIKREEDKKLKYEQDLYLEMLGKIKKKRNKEENKNTDHYIKKRKSRTEDDKSDSDSSDHSDLRDVERDKHTTEHKKKKHKKRKTKEFDSDQDSEESIHSIPKEHSNSNSFKSKTKKKKHKSDSKFHDDTHNFRENKYRDTQRTHFDSNDRSQSRDERYDRDNERTRDSSHNNQSRDKRYNRDNERNDRHNFHHKKRISGWDQETNDNGSPHDTESYSRNNTYNDTRRSTNHNHTREWDRGKHDRQRENGQYSNENDSRNDKPKEKKDEPNFKLSGKLTEYTNTYNGVVIMYNEPPEARKPKTRWRLYPFKGEESLQMLQLHRQSAFLLGRDRKIADIPVDHPSCSKQHSVLQFRLVDYERPDGAMGRKVKPYIIDLDSTNGTFVNNKKIDPRRYVELIEKDVLKFGFSSRDYVILHEKSKDDESGSEDDGENDDENDENALKMKSKEK